MTIKLEVGQTLYQPPSNIRGNGRTMTVTKIGRKWVTLRFGERCTIDTLHLDCGVYIHQQLWLSESDYLQSIALSRAWQTLNRDMSARMKPGVTLEAINQARALLMLDETPA
jgi:hypothetical protein